MNARTRNQPDIFEIGGDMARERNDTEKVPIYLPTPVQGGAGK